MAEKTKKAAKSKVAKKAKSAGTGSAWRLGLFRNAHGRLVTVYVNSDGSVMPYEQPRVGNAPILFMGAYKGMKYSEARLQLLKDAKKDKGLENEVVEKAPKAAKTKAPKASKKVAKVQEAKAPKAPKGPAAPRRPKVAASAPTS